MNKLDCIIGVDPGLDGAIAIIDLKNNSATIYDMPTVAVSNGKKKKRELFVQEIVSIFNSIIKKYRYTVAYVEKVHAMPGQGVVSQFSFGVSFGIIQGILSSLNIKYNLIPPQSWKKTILEGMPKDKGASVVKASQIYPGPEYTTERGRVLDGRGDAICIAEYGRLNERIEIQQDRDS